MGTDLMVELREHGTLSRMRHRIERLGPYQSLVLLAVPTAVVEPLKLVAVAIAGEGHWITGTLVIIAAYAASLLLVERLFTIVKPKLMTLNWFARLWRRKMAQGCQGDDLPMDQLGVACLVLGLAYLVPSVA